MRQRTYRTADTATRGGDTADTALLRAVEADLNAEGWDRPPLLAVLRREPAAAAARTLPATDLFRTAHPRQVLAALADALAGDPHEPPRWLARALHDRPRQFSGWILATEAWTLPRDVTDAQHDRYAGYVASGRRIADHPDGIECRTVTATVLPTPAAPGPPRPAGSCSTGNAAGRPS